MRGKEKKPPPGGQLRRALSDRAASSSGPSRRTHARRPPENRAETKRPTTTFDLRRQASTPGSAEKKKRATREAADNAGGPWTPAFGVTPLVSPEDARGACHARHLARPVPAAVRSADSARRTGTARTAPRRRADGGVPAVPLGGSGKRCAVTAARAESLGSSTGVSTSAVAGSERAATFTRKPGKVGVAARRNSASMGRAGWPRTAPRPPRRSCRGGDTPAPPAMLPMAPSSRRRRRRRRRRHRPRQPPRRCPRDAARRVPRRRASPLAADRRPLGEGHAGARSGGRGPADDEDGEDQDERLGRSRSGRERTRS